MDNHSFDDWMPIESVYAKKITSFFEEDDAFGKEKRGLVGMYITD
jgi:hypothetical protein